MEMSVGTIVTVVLLMAVLILGIFLVQKIFSGSSDAIDSINNQVINEINGIFENPAAKISVAPNDRSITLDKGDETPKGFAFSVKNTDTTDHSYTFTVLANDVSNCGGSFTTQEANTYVLGGTGNFNLGRGSTLELPRLVKFDLPESAPPCTIVYQLDVKQNGNSYTGADVFVTIK